MSPSAICDYSSSRISSIVSAVPNIEAMIAETKSNIPSLFASESAGADGSEC